MSTIESPPFDDLYRFQAAETVVGVMSDGVKIFRVVRREFSTVEGRLCQPAKLIVLIANETFVILNTFN